MKNLLYLAIAVIIAYYYSGCSTFDEGELLHGTTEMFGGYDQNEAGVMMTLSALCYTAEGNTNAMQIRDSIILQLADTNYATGGNWKLCWGPGLSVTGDNLLYAAVDSTSNPDTIQYAICVRGTVFNFANIEQDLEVWKMARWPYSGTSDSIAIGSLMGLDTLLNTTDPVNSQTLLNFILSLNYPKQKMFITGHSLGGAMATLITSWFFDVGLAVNFKTESYTFAAPTVGNVSFVTSFHNKLLSAGAENHRCVNSKDVVPYAWAGLTNIISENIPTQVPPLVAATITTVHQILQDSGIVYKHVETKKSLGTINPSNCGTIGEYDTYFCWVGFEHSSATYLRLLGADTINWGR